MKHKTRFLWSIVAGISGLVTVLLLAGCLISPSTRQVGDTAPPTVTGITPPSIPNVSQGVPGGATPLPSMCTFDVAAHPSDAFRLKIQVKNRAGEPAPGARVFVTFYDGNPDGPEQVWADDQGIAVLDLTTEQLTVPKASGNSLGVLSFDLAVFWNNPNAGPESVSTCASQDIDLASPAEIIVTVNLEDAILQE